jgi:hypothetical protein
MRATGTLRFVAAGAACLAALVGMTAATTASASARVIQDPVPIGPNELFSGFVNNAPPGPAIIKVVCAVGATTGVPIGNQPVEVKTASVSGTTDVGNTGSNGNQITASLGAAVATIVIAHFTSYFVPVDIPTNITVPCSGSGTVVFTPSPSGTGARSAVLPVTFANIAS